MKKLMTVGLLTLACFGLNLAAQDWYHDRDGRFQGEGWRGHLFEHVRVDLEYVMRGGLPPGKEARRLENTKRELRDLQAKLEANRFDQGELNDVIDSVRKSANDDRLPPRDKEVLRDDLNRLIDYRDHHEHWIR
jgi:hypothetical protein